MKTIVHVGLGSNLDDRRGHLDRAVQSLRKAEGCEQITVSPYYETNPVGGPTGQQPYLNAAAEVETTLSAITFLDLLQAIEQQEGRVRRDHWGERTLDLDLLLFGDQVINTKRLVVPHPRMMLRMFVLAPLSTIAPEAVEPRSGKRIQQLLDNCQARPGEIDLPGWKTVVPNAFLNLTISLSNADWRIHDSLAESDTHASLPTFRVLWKQVFEKIGEPPKFESAWPPKVEVDTSHEQLAVLEVITTADATRSAGNFWIDSKGSLLLPDHLS